MSWLAELPDHDELDPTGFHERRAPSIEETLDDERGRHDPDDPLAEALRPLVTAEGEVDLDRGFVDAFGMLRVWIDASGLIHEVRVSPAWRQRAAKAAPAADARLVLQTAFGQVFAAINATRPDPGWINPFDTEDVEAGDTTLTWDSLSAWHEQVRLLQQEWEQVPPEQASGRWAGDFAVGEAAEGNIRLTLDQRGAYAAIHFDEQWLKTSRVTQLCEGVPAAARDAFTAFVPPTYVPGAYDLLAQRHQVLTRQLTAMLKRGFR